MSLEAFHTGLDAAITADAALASWADGVKTGATLTTMGGNRDLRKLSMDVLPLVVYEIGEAESAMVVGNYAQETEAELLTVVIWHEPDPASAYTQRLQLTQLMVQAVMADPTLGQATVGGAWVSGWESAAAEHNPAIHLMRFSVKAMFEIPSP